MAVRTVRWLATPVVAGVVAVAGLTSVTGAGADPGEQTRSRVVVRNVIFINGDGMGAAHRKAAQLYRAGRDGRLAMDRLPFSGKLTTSPNDPDQSVTDSAAGASAWATGVRTYNSAISVNINGRPLPTLGAQAKAAGKATGLVTTAQVTDASPAAFFANATNRKKHSEIARQYLQVSRPDVILGGGEDWWLPPSLRGAHRDRTAADRSEHSRGTRGNLIAKARAAGYEYVSTPAQLAAARRGKLLGLFANEEMFEPRQEGNGDVYHPSVSLPAMTMKALTILSRDRDGFFLVVEEQAIDEFAHRHNGRRMLQAMGALDRTVAVARAYAAAHRDTLVVVTGDHETGGLIVQDHAGEAGAVASAYDGPFRVKGSSQRFVLRWTTNRHTGTAVPVTAYGPLAARFSGKHRNTYVHEVLAPVLTR